VPTTSATFAVRSTYSASSRSPASGSSL
jgi:hypothetical protein